MWRPYLNHTFDGNEGFSLNVSIPADLTGSIEAIVEGEYIIGGTSGSNDEEGLTLGTMWALSLAPGHRRHNCYGTEPLCHHMTQDQIVSVRSLRIWTCCRTTVDVENQSSGLKNQLTRKLYVYDLDTMQLLWESEPGPQWDFYGMSQTIAYGMTVQLWVRRSNRCL